MPEGFETPSDNNEQQVEDMNKAAAPEVTAEPSDRETIETPIKEEETGGIEWVFKDGKWVPVQVGAPKPEQQVTRVEPGKAVEPTKEEMPLETGWDKIGSAGVQTRVIEIPVDLSQAVKTGSASEVR